MLQGDIIGSKSDWTSSNFPKSIGFSVLAFNSAATGSSSIMVRYPSVIRQGPEPDQLVKLALPNTSVFMRCRAD